MSQYGSDYDPWGFERGLEFEGYSDFNSTIESNLEFSSFSSLDGSEAEDRSGETDFIGKTIAGLKKGVQAGNTAASSGKGATTIKGGNATGANLSNTSKTAALTSVNPLEFERAWLSRMQTFAKIQRDTGVQS